MVKRGYNWKARQVVDTVIDNSDTKRIKLDLDASGSYDQSNELVLPAKKRKTKIKTKTTKVTKILSNKQRKRLEKIVEKKQKKELTADLFKKLAEVQATPEEIRQLTSITKVQTRGLKKIFSEENTLINENCREAKGIVLNSIKGARRQLISEEKIERNSDPNIVGFESSDYSSTDSEDDETNEKEEENAESIEAISLKNETNNTDIQGIKEVTPGADGEINVDVTVGRDKAKQNKEQKNHLEVKPVIRKPAVFVEVNRSDEIQKARLKLPILAEEQQIMEVINDNSVIIVAGETGSGKTTQVPQFLYEAGYALKKMIGITEPRRVAAISMSKRVAEEMNLSSEEVSYLIRFEGNATENTKIKFMTDGVLFRELKDDFLLTKYSVIILDEAHERSVYTDVLIGMLSRIVPLRQKRNNPLKLIIMSATLRIQDFTENRRLFKVAPPVINVEARQFPVTVHFNRRTNENYLKEALRKTSKIHTTLPEGGILVFVTGQREVNHLVQKLRSMFPLKQKDKFLKIAKSLDRDTTVKEESTDDETFEDRLKRVVKKQKKKIKIIPEIDLDEYKVGDEENDSNDEEHFNSEDEDVDDILISPPVNAQPLWVLPLYSFLPSHRQAEVFLEPPSGCRLCVVSTNVAETSLTIPNIKYVVDTGKTKVKLYDKVTGVTSYAIDWTSKASADQRAGRAGRTGPGHCYRLYSSAVFNDVLQQFSVPEIQRKPVDDLYLQMKCMHLDKIVNFPFPTAPDLMQLKTAESRLEALELIENSKVTPLGRAVAKFPVLPRYGKMLALSLQFDLLPYAICMVAALSVQEVLLETPIGPSSADIQENWSIKRRSWAGQVVDPKLAPPTDLQAKLFRQLLLCGMADQIAKKMDPDEIKDKENKAKYKYAYKANDMEDPVFLHRGSVLKKTLPQYVIYQEVYETNKMYIRGITAIEPEWLPIYVPKLCNLGKPHADPEPWYEESSGKVKCIVSGSFGRQAWPLQNTEVEYPKSVEAYKWFTKFFLEGKVFSKLSKYNESLLQPASVVTKPWARLQPRIVRILNRMTSMDCRSRKNVEDVWENDPQFLLEEYLLWVPESVHKALAQPSSQAAINHEGALRLHFIEGVGDIIEIEGKLTAEKYRTILEQHAIPFGGPLIGNNFFLQQGNAPKHTSGLIKNYYASSKKTE
ncbi:putative ATP-dependent helicase [Trypoxylus dichotomus]